MPLQSKTQKYKTLKSQQTDSQHTTHSGQQLFPRFRRWWLLLNCRRPTTVTPAISSTPRIRGRVPSASSGGCIAAGGSSKPFLKHVPFLVTFGKLFRSSTYSLMKSLLNRSQNYKRTTLEHERLFQSFII